MTTNRLYFTDSYLTEFDASVVELADGGRRVYLDRTAFYPTSGGQACDFGRLAGIRVLDVVDEEERIAHLLEAPLTAETAHGSVDWVRRFDHMQQHSGQHLLSAVLADRFDCQTVSVHFGAVSSTLDLDREILSHDAIREAEAAANAIVTENRAVSIGFEDAAAATATGLRKPSDRSGTLRIVAIADLDRSACGGTHVRRTGEIGPILIRKTERVRKLLRLEFLCGTRAAVRSRTDLEILSRLAALASAGIDELGPAFERQASDLRKSESARRELETELHRYRARDLYHLASPDNSGRHVIIERAGPEGPVTSVEALRGLAQAVVTLPRAVLIATWNSPPTLLLAASEDSDLDAARLLKTVLEEVGGRGGGSARLAQGVVTGDSVEPAFARLMRALGEKP